MILKQCVPDEWLRAAAATSQIYRAVHASSSGVLRDSAGLLAPFAVGAVAAWFIDPQLSRFLVIAVITMLGILGGFLMNLILFTGQINRMDYLDNDEAEQYRHEVMFLLWNQTTTLLVFVLTMVLSVAWFYVQPAAGPDGVVPDPGATSRLVTALLGGGAFVSLLRAILIPLQLLELHYFGLTVAVAYKESRYREDLERQREDLREESAARKRDENE